MAETSFWVRVHLITVDRKCKHQFQFVKSCRIVCNFSTRFEGLQNFNLDGPLLLDQESQTSHK